MSFKFKLERVLAYRRQMEEQAMQLLAAAGMRREREEARLIRLEEELGHQNISLTACLAAGEERRLILSFINALLTDAAAARANLALLREEEARLRAELVEKAKERELLDKLKSRQAERHALEEKLMEQRENDETATIRHGRQALALL
jgi:flagellar FliJ protein